MLPRRRFIKHAASVTALAVLFPSFSINAFSKPTKSSGAEREKFTHLMNKWVSLYDVHGGYITDIKLLESVEEKSTEQVEQFSLNWGLRDDIELEQGTYILEDFKTTPRPIYLVPSYNKNERKRYRAPFSILKN